MLQKSASVSNLDTLMSSSTLNNLCSSSLGNSYSFDYNYDAGSPIITSGNNKKETMQNLNKRLASYLEKVRYLEEENIRLEEQICEWYEKRRPVNQDWSEYEKMIANIQTEINKATVAKTEVVLQLDNAKLAADDFKVKYNNEVLLKQSTETDVNSLRKLLSDLDLSKHDLEKAVDNVNDEINYLKKNHKEEMTALRAQTGPGVNVEVDSSPGMELVKILADVRAQYENMAEKNRRDAEEWYNNKCDVLNQQLTTSTETLETYKSETVNLRRTIQTLEIELQSTQSIKISLDETLEETQNRYGLQLQQLQQAVNTLEAELGQLRMETERQSIEYAILLDTKTRLEMEINTYRQLMEEKDIGSKEKYSIHEKHK
ncbi:keratin, type I cytoskeletal 19-like [Protopterus annectens]|uniref:keratin, type I cytoskeletal 19-like n=1 Tax=Protopterus annectens TaxID=7888 RepID=UPI001CFB9EE7|nr:keratin, type I cytoskeletal 19-like [Protopterus annectens]